jgi:RNA polymerase sigma-70 factor (ECF subfamily)
VEDHQQLLLLKRISAGDEEACRELYRIYERRLLAFLRRMTGNTADAEECLGDVMVAVWRRAQTFRGNSRVATWLFGIAYYKAMDKLRDRPQADFTDPGEAEIIPDSKPDPSISLLGRQRRERIGSALAQLSPEHRAVIELTFYLEMSYAEIAQIMNCPIGTVKSRVFHALKHLRPILAAMGLEGG